MSDSYPAGDDDGGDDPPKLTDDRPFGPIGDDGQGNTDIPVSDPPPPPIADDGDFDGPQVSGGGDAVNVPYEPPPPPEGPVMRPDDGSGGDPEGPEHDLEDERTKLMSEGEGSGQDEETPEPPGVD